MHFTQGQLRETLGISIETFRHWKRVLPPFTGRKRQASCFSIADLVGAAVLHRLTSSCGVRVGYLAAVSEEIMRLCHSSTWHQLEKSTLVVDLSKGVCRLISDEDKALDGEVAFVCRMKPILLELREALLDSQPSVEQRAFAFSPIGVGSGMQARRSGT